LACFNNSVGPERIKDGKMEKKTFVELSVEPGIFSGWQCQVWALPALAAAWQNQFLVLLCLTRISIWLDPDVKGKPL